MYYQNRFDSHVHSDCSPDGRDSVICLAEQAVRRDLSGISITDYCDISCFAEMQCSQRLRESIYSVYKARAAFANKLIIGAGVEISHPLADIKLAEETVSSHPFDVVLCSVKTFPDGTGFDSIDFTELTSTELRDRLYDYYEYMLKTVKWGGFDVLAHLSYPMRYIYNFSHSDFSLHMLDDHVEEVLRVLAGNGKALEISTADLRGDLGCIIPQRRYIRRFFELGGTYVTIGSGAHDISTLGSDISDGMLAALESGFKDFTFFKQRQPKLLKII